MEITTFFSSALTFRERVQIVGPDTLQQNRNCVHPNSWKPYFKAQLKNIKNLILTNFACKKIR